MGFVLQLRQNLDKKDKKKKRKKDKKDRKGDKEKKKEKKHKRRSSSSEEEDGKKHRCGVRYQSTLCDVNTLCDLVSKTSNKIFSSSES